MKKNRILSSVHSLSRLQLFATPWTAARQASLSVTNSQSWLRLMSIEQVMPSNRLILCRPLLLLPSIFPNIMVFSNEYSGLISFRVDWLDLLAAQFSHSVMSDSLQPHEPQHARPPCPLPTAGVYPNSCPLSWWCHPTILSSVVPFSPRPQSFPASGPFQMNQLFTWGGQSIGISVQHQSF